ncbi:MAG: oligoendopeptidase F [Ezakiella sp.]|nr:oligoendopeptidase F [Ezakiella sp.]
MEYKSRNEIDEKYKWSLESLFSSSKDAERAIDELDKKIEKMASFKGEFTKSAQNLLEALKTKDELEIELGKTATYISNRFNENNGDSYYMALSDRLDALFAKYSAITSYFRPELMEKDYDYYKKFIEECPELELYDYYIWNILRYKDHTLDSKSEEMLAKLAPTFQSGSKSFSMLTNADLKFPKVELDDGEVTITNGNFVPLLTDASLQKREEIFGKFYSVYEDHINTLASTLDANTKAISINAKLRGYGSAREEALFDNQIPLEVYDNLLKTVNDNLDALHDYVAVRKKVLGLDKLHMYDVYKNLVADLDIKYSFDEAKSIILEALKPLGEDYITNLEKGFNDRWCDVYETPGKRGGAYSSGSYGTDPYVLLNYHGTLDDVFTVAHEMGHSMHSYYSRQNQPCIYSDYSIFVAEVASTTNESLLTFYLLDKWKDDPKKKMYILNHFMDSIKGTLFRQTQFAEYEKAIYDHYEKGGALTPEFLSDKYNEINKKYYGPHMEEDDYIRYEWARIPHFYYDFYVYQYATGISAALSFAKRILEGGENERDMYIEFLKSGSSSDPISVLKKAGVDMSSPKPIEDAINLFREFKDEFKKLI